MESMYILTIERAYSEHLVGDPYYNTPYRHGQG